MLVSLLTPTEVAELQLEDEPRLCEAAGLAYFSFPIADRDVPRDRDARRELVGQLITDIQAGRGVAIHCRSGIGRSALIAACVLTATGRSTDEAFKIIGDPRGRSVPDTPEQREWAAAFHY